MNFIECFQQLAMPVKDATEDLSNKPAMELNGWKRITIITNER